MNTPQTAAARPSEAPREENDSYSFEVDLPWVTFIGVQIGDEMAISAHGGTYDGARARFTTEEIASRLPLQIAPPRLSARSGRTATILPGLYAAVSDIEFLTRWYRDGVEIPGATEASYTLRSPEDDHAAIEYREVPVSACGRPSGAPYVVRVQEGGAAAGMDARGESVTS